MKRKELIENIEGCRNAIKILQKQLAQMENEMISKARYEVGDSFHTPIVINYNEYPGAEIKEVRYSNYYKDIEYIIKPYARLQWPDEDTSTYGFSESEIDSYFKSDNK